MGEKIHGLGKVDKTPLHHKAFSWVSGGQQNKKPEKHWNMKVN